MFTHSRSLRSLTLSPLPPPPIPPTPHPTTTDTQKSVNENRVKLARVYLSLKFTDGTTMDVVSNANAKGGWTVAEGAITHTDIYDGEYVDLRKDDPAWNHLVNDATAASPLKWQPATAAAPPTPTTLVTSHAVLPKIGVRESYSPIAMYQSSPGEYVFDFGQNMAGVVTFSLPAGVAGPQSAGTTVSLLHAEAVHGPPPAKIFHHYGNTAEIVNITLAGDGRAVKYTPKFTYMGFRYVQLTGYPGVPTFETVTAHFLNTMYDLTGEISFSDPNLDAVQHITRMAAMSNFQSIPTDCPQRERRGWLGDAQLSSRTNTFNFGMAGAYVERVEKRGERTVLWWWCACIVVCIVVNRKRGEEGRAHHPMVLHVVVVCVCWCVCVRMCG